MLLTDHTECFLLSSSYFKLEINIFKDYKFKLEVMYLYLSNIKVT